MEFRKAEAEDYDAITELFYELDSCLNKIYCLVIIESLQQGLSIVYSLLLLCVKA